MSYFIKRIDYIVRFKINFRAIFNDKADCFSRVKDTGTRFFNAGTEPPINPWCTLCVAMWAGVPVPDLPRGGGQEPARVLHGDQPPLHTGQTRYTNQGTVGCRCRGLTLKKKKFQVSF